jgi:CheY-like chemotaxis protein
MRASTSVLVVEDDPVIRRSLIRALASDGFSAQAVHTCSAARELAGRFDWAVLDVDLTDGTGTQLASELLSRGMTSNIVFFTGSNDRTLLARARGLGQLLNKSQGVPALLGVLAEDESAPPKSRTSHALPEAPAQVVAERAPRVAGKQRRSAR